MARIALIHIRDDHTADDMVGSPLPSGAQWVGMFDFPSRAELRRGCPGCTRPPKKVQGWTRNRRGFMECASCGGRNPRLRQWLIGALFDYVGANLYQNAPAAFRTPEGYGSYADND